MFYLFIDQKDAVPEAASLGSHVFLPKGSDTPVTFNVTRGDYAPLMKLLADNLAKAKVTNLR